MKQVTLETLFCETTEDTSGRLRPPGDLRRTEKPDPGAARQARQRRAVGGQTRQGPLRREVDVRLFDEDGDLPATTTTRSAWSPSARRRRLGAVGVFDQDGADYRLTYTVIDRSDLAATIVVELELAGLRGLDGGRRRGQRRQGGADRRHAGHDRRSESRGRPELVPVLRPDVDRLRARPHAMPRRYVRLCRSLYETGTSRAARRPSRRRDGLRAASVGQGMSVADWMLIATMRESENAIFGVDPDARGVARRTPGARRPPGRWRAGPPEILLKDTTAISTTFVWGEMDAIRYAEQVYAAGGVAFMMIHDVLLTDDDDSTVPPWPTHWVVYQGGLTRTRTPARSTSTSTRGARAARSPSPSTASSPACSGSSRASSPAPPPRPPAAVGRRARSRGRTSVRRVYQARRPRAHTPAPAPSGAHPSREGVVPHARHPVAARDAGGITAALLDTLDQLVDRVLGKQTVDKDGKPLRQVAYMHMPNGLPIDPRQYANPWTPAGGATLPGCSRTARSPRSSPPPGAAGAAAAGRPRTAPAGAAAPAAARPRRRPSPCRTRS